MASLRRQSGLTIFETLVAATLLIIGVLATFVMIDVANGTDANASARESATNLSRELLESAHATPYAQIGSSGWITPELQNISGGSTTVTSPTTNSQRTTVTRRGVTYTVTLSWCSEDDSKDGYGTHPVSTPWCSDSTGTGTSDGQPEDFKRVTAQIDWAGAGNATQLKHTVTFSATGAAIGPSTTGLIITTPSGLNQSAPVITSNPPNGIAVFQGTSLGAADMKFSVNGQEQLTGVTNNNNGTWNFNWDVSGLKDGTYTISAVAVDILGTRGPPKTMQVTLNRGAPAPLSGLTGGYNYVNVAGTKTLVVELAWDANPEGSVTGYQVVRGATNVCSTSLSTTCMDLSPPQSGTTAYTVKTFYKDATGAIQSISTTYNVTAPSTATIPQTYGYVSTTANVGTGCYDPVASGASGGGLRRDASPNYPTSGGTQQTFSSTAGGGIIAGCFPVFGSPAPTISAGTNTVTFNGWFTNTSTSLACNNLQWLVSWGASIALSNLIAGGGANGGATVFPSVPANTTTPTRFTQTTNTAAKTFASGDQLTSVLGNFTGSSTKKSPLYDCTKTTFYYGSGAYQSTITLSTLVLASSGATLSQPAAPGPITIVHNADGTNTLTWNAATGTPAPDFYRIYRDGQNYTNRFDTAGDTGTATITWTDTATGGTTHTYYVTTAAATLTESATMAGPVSG